MSKHTNGKKKTHQKEAPIIKGTDTRVPGIAKRNRGE